MKCVARLWLPLSAKQAEGRRARWQPALLCWSKRKLLLPGDRRLKRRLAFSKTICAPDLTVEAVKVSYSVSWFHVAVCLLLDTHVLRREREIVGHFRPYITPCCYLAVTHSGARLIPVLLLLLLLLAVELGSSRFDVPLNVILVRPNIYMLEIWELSLWQPAATPVSPWCVNVG